MKNKIFLYLFKMKTKYIFFNIFVISLFIQVINILEITKVIEKENSNLITILYLSFLKLPSVIIEVMPFVVVISTAFLFRYLIANNELIAMRNVGYSIIDIFKPIALSILFIGYFMLIFINPISAKFEIIFDNLTTKDFSDMYSIKIKNDELWIKNLNNEKDIYYIYLSDMDFKSMNTKKFKILSVSNNNNILYLGNEANLDDNFIYMNDVTLFNINRDFYEKKETLKLKLNFKVQDLIDSFSNYKFIPFYKYKDHLNSLKKFNLYSPEISLYYLSEILKPIFLIIISFAVMGFSGKFKKNENFFKILFFSILIGFAIFMLKEIVSAITVSYSLPFILTYFIILFVPFIIGLYQIINIEIN
tara:strand:+ start:1787 stop:2869 length:1083 start_codon:yes stop_codon:yes gene_type:complete